jgi:hypothetical protein
VLVVSTGAALRPPSVVTASCGRGAVAGCAATTAGSSAAPTVMAIVWQPMQYTSSSSAVGGAQLRARGRPIAAKKDIYSSALRHTIYSTSIE